MAGDPCDAEAGVPLVLFPVRLETRFGEDGKVLRIRIFPDDVHVDRRRGEDGGKGPPVARALPDRFLVRVAQGEELALATGEAIPTTLAVGIANEPDPAGIARHEGLTLGRGMEWLVDYEQAERVGMAVAVQLPRPGQAVDSLLAFGVRGSLDAAAGAAELERLLASHAASGAAFVPQGTPTNNTEAERSGWQGGPPPLDASEGEGQEEGGELPEDADAAVLARALGVEPALLARFENAAGREQGLARAANAALWEQTWGAYLDAVTAPGGNGIDPAARRALRELHRDHVRGRGPLPAIRLGDQPYGVLPVSAHQTRWKPASEPPEPHLTETLRRARELLAKGIDAVPRVTDEADLHDSLREIFGSGPASLGLRARSLISSTTGKLSEKVAGQSNLDTLFQSLFDAMLWDTLGFDRRTGIGGLLGRDTLPLALPLVAASDSEYIAALLGEGGEKGKVESVLQALLELGDDAERDREALGALAAAGEKERRLVLAETVDTASHRLDAWVTAVVSERLEGLRSARPTGAILGAYGWLENLEPEPERPLRGGYVHAPSLAHATSAGILQSAYLSHDRDGEGGGAFAVDLSSSRARTAVGLAQGIRAGQPLEALLGYRFERRLHEAGLDRFVLNLRALAPLLTGSTDDVDEPGAREAIAATNVVDGTALLARPRAEVRAALQRPPENPYLDPGDWEPPDAEAWARIEAALDEIAAAADALADMLVAESVHQLAQGNAARAAAALDAARGEGPPPELEFARTEASGVPLTHRLLLLAPADAPATAGWNAAAPRAAAEPRLERWAAARLGPAGAIRLGRTDAGERIDMDRAGLAALDLVFGAAQPEALERRLRSAVPGLGEEPLAERTYLDALEHAAALGRVLAAGRPATAAAFARPGDLGSERASAATIDGAAVAELEKRLRTAQSGLSQAAEELDVALADEDGAALGAALDALAAYGVPLPAEVEAATARGAGDEAARRLAAAAAILDPAGDGPPAGLDASRAAVAGKALFGEEFWVLPLITGAAAALASAPAGSPPGPARIRRFLHDVGSVRPAAAALAEGVLIGSTLVSQPALGVAQLSGEEATEWVGGRFDSAELASVTSVTGIVYETTRLPGEKEPVAGLVIDEWVEAMPSWRRREDANGDAVRERVQTTGVTLPANAPGARPPQAILLAVSPDGERWSTEALAATIAETLELAKLRAVTLERAPWLGRIMPALLVRSWSLQGSEKMLDVERLAGLLSVAEPLPFVLEPRDG